MALRSAAICFWGTFTSSGTIRLVGARIKGNLECTGAKLDVKDGDALFADLARIDGKVLLINGFRSSGKIRFIGAQIEGGLDIYGAEVAEVSCENLRLSGDLIWMGIHKSAETKLYLPGASVKKMHDDRESWPREGGLDLDGFVYEELTQHERPSSQEVAKNKLTKQLALSSEERVEWLMLQGRERCADAQPWMHLSKQFEGKGDSEGAGSM